MLARFPAAVIVSAVLAGLVELSGCTRGVYKGGHDGGPRPVTAPPSPTAVSGTTVTVGPEGGRVATTDGAFAIQVPKDAFPTTSAVTIAPAGTGAHGVTLYRVTLDPVVTLAHAVSVTLDANRARTSALDEDEVAGVGLGSGNDPVSPPGTDALPIIGQSTNIEGIFYGITFEAERIFGLVDTPILGPSGSFPACVRDCCSGQVATVHPPNACGCATMNDEVIACLLDGCVRDELVSGCAP